MTDIYQLARHSVAGLITLLAFTVLLGLAYPLAVTGISAVAAPWQARGSLVTADGSRTTDPDRAVGSAILGQAAGPSLFQPRPSMAGEGWDPRATAWSNLGPLDEELVATIGQRRAEIAEREGCDPSDVPADAVTASFSGLDPDISPAYADLQVPRVARQNGLSEEEVRRLVDENTSGRTAGVLGDPHVNVLMLNIAVREAAS